jgi:hypothetical protein
MISLINNDYQEAIITQTPFHKLLCFFSLITHRIASLMLNIYIVKVFGGLGVISFLY